MKKHDMGYFAKCGLKKNSHRSSGGNDQSIWEQPYSTEATIHIRIVSIRLLVLPQPVAADSAAEGKYAAMAFSASHVVS